MNAFGVFDFRPPARAIFTFALELPVIIGRNELLSLPLAIFGRQGENTT